MMLKRFSFAVLISLVLVALAQAAAWVVPVTPTQVITGNAAGLYMQLITAETILNPGNCVTADSYIVRDPAIINASIATALAEQAAGRQLRVYVVDTCDAPTGRPLVVSVGML